MKIFFRILSLFLVAMLSGHAYGDDTCANYRGSRITLSAADAQFLKSAIAIFKNKKRGELRAISAAKLKLARRYVSGGVDTRGGNLWLDLEPGQIDKKFRIHVGKMTMPSSYGYDEVHFGPQMLVEFSDEFFEPKTDGTGIMLTHGVCDGFEQCSVVPLEGELLALIGGLLRCNDNENAAFVFSDGILLTDMMKDVYEAVGLRVGVALFFSKTPSGYKLAALISFQ